eukprot:jgi/Hompol1/851/HPOL_001405-RA
MSDQQRPAAVQPIGIQSRKQPSSADECPEQTASLLSKLTFSWMNPVLWLGWKRPLEASDIWKLPSRLQAEPLISELQQAWDEELLTHPEPLPEGKSLRRVIWKLFAGTGFQLTFIQIVCNTCTVMTPFVIKLIIGFVVDSKAALVGGSQMPSLGYGIGLAFLFLFLQLAASVLANYFFITASKLGIAVRTALVGTIYRKTLRLSPLSSQNFNSGKITNLVSTDAPWFIYFMTYAPMMLASSVQLLVIIVMLILQIGPSALVVLAAVFCLAPLQKKIFDILGSIRARVAPLTDARIKLTQEILQGIRVIKFFAWESAMISQVEDIRKKELALVFQKCAIDAANTSISSALPILAAAIAFIIYAISNPLDPTRVFSALAWFGQIPISLLYIQLGIEQLAQVKMSAKRIQEMLVAEELDGAIAIDANATFAISVENADFTWEERKETIEGTKNGNNEENKKNENEEEDTTVVVLSRESDVLVVPDANTTTTTPTANKSTLRNINLAIPHGQLVAIVGAVGSG